MQSTKTIIMIDVESNGLYGDPFALGITAWDNSGVLTTQGYHLKDYVPTDPWVLKHVRLSDQSIAVLDLHLALIGFLQRYVGREIQLWTDVIFPVEANFLLQTFRETSLSPYPVYDLHNLLDCSISRKLVAEMFIKMGYGAQGIDRIDEPHEAIADSLHSMLALLAHDKMSGSCNFRTYWEVTKN